MQDLMWTAAGTGSISNPISFSHLFRSSINETRSAQSGPSRWMSRELDSTQLVAPARMEIEQASNREVAKTAKSLVDQFERILAWRDDVSSLPPLRAVEDVDGSIVVEWIFSTFRMGFNFEVDKSESSWNLVGDASMSWLNASASLENDMPISHLIWLIGFVLLDQYEIAD